MSSKEDEVIKIFADKAVSKGYQVLSFDLPEQRERKNDTTYLCKVQNESPAAFYGRFGVIDPAHGNVDDKNSAVRITATTPAKQKITLTLSPKVN